MIQFDWYFSTGLNPPTSRSFFGTIFGGWDTFSLESNFFPVVVGPQKEIYDFTKDWHFVV